jgi:hypothetical protein
MLPTGSWGRESMPPGPFVISAKQRSEQNMTLEQQVFSPAEVEAFRADDRSAATAIVGLMAGIFALGLIGYIGVCLWVG